MKKRDKAMNVSITKAKFDEKNMWLTLSDGRMLGVPLALFPLLERATPQQLGSYELSPRGIHWYELNEDLSLDGLLSPTPLSPNAQTVKTVGFNAR